MKRSLLEKLERLSERLAEIECLLGGEHAARDMDSYRKLTRERADIMPVVGLFHAYRSAGADHSSAAEMLGDPEMKELAIAEQENATATMDRLEVELQRALLPKDPNDDRNLFLEIRAGTGGDESALFAADLFRMYSRYAERQRWKVDIVSRSESDLGGFREVIARIEGSGAYSKLKFESGGHRVQRVPVTETQGRIHTSACTVAVMPEADELVDVDIKPVDLRIDTFRASGAGGQHINKTDSAVRLTHIPTGIVVQCQDGRSQHSNRDVAWKRLRSRLYDFEMRKRQAEQQKLEDSKTDVGWGHQIRSYVLDNSRIKDLRTNVEVSATQKVLDGDLDVFIEASLKQGV
jgi:peptide chain release factor 1